MTYVIPPPPPACLPVMGREARFPVRRVYCVGQNYADHVVEMGGDPDREAPFFFQKNADDLVAEGGDIPYPTETDDLHHEVELVVALKDGGAGIAAAEAMAHVYGYAVGIDFTRRDRQAEAKKAGRPWIVGKAIDRASPVSALVPVSEIGTPDTGRIWLEVNGETRQSGDLGQMIWKVPEIIAELSRFFTLAPGDVIFTGTPAGVSPVGRGDQVRCGVEAVGTLNVTIV